MGTVARSGLIGAIMGNTAERMIRTIRASLLALKPVDFKCPIRPE
jgi:nucleotide-binding universal stress UspA family protein